MKSKSKANYSQIFAAVENLANQRGLSIFGNKKVFLGDFEMDAITTFQKCFPAVEFQGCYFHFAHSILRKIESRIVACSCAYRNNNHFKLFVRRIIGTALLPIEFITIKTLQLLFEEF
ncbi:hypothetical protein EIN_414750, partial [Entamoeba invadens IP1]